MAALAALAASFNGAVATEKRVALVIGNSAYRNAPALPNPANDASDIAAELQKLGFDVVRGIDLDFNGMRDTLRRYTAKLANADAALFFYAGHGLQVAGKNYLVPIDAQIESLADLNFSTLDVDLIINAMDSDSRTNIVILDACRDNPFTRSLARGLATRSASIGRGLAEVQSGNGMLIAYSTQPGNVALDGDGRNSPFTGALVRLIGQPGVTIGDLMIAVRNQVYAVTNGRQKPWDSSSLMGQFYFNPRAANTVDAPAANSTATTFEITFWNSIKDTKNPQLFEAYLKRYPNGAFADIAKIDLEQFRVAVAKPIAAAPDARVTISDPGLLREIRDRLYELNFDPGSPDADGLKPAIREFEAQNKLALTGAVSQGLLTRLREIGGLRPWGAIIYDSSRQKWGMAWNADSRREAVASARATCGAAQCTSEVSFFGTACGAFALSATNWSIDSRDNIQDAREAALDACGKRGKACRIIGATCADGANRATSAN